MERKVAVLARREWLGRILRSSNQPSKVREHVSTYNDIVCIYIVRELNDGFLSLSEHKDLLLQVINVRLHPFSAALAPLPQFNLAQSTIASQTFTTLTNQTLNLTAKLTPRCLPIPPFMNCAPTAPDWVHPHKHTTCYTDGTLSLQLNAS